MTRGLPKINKLTNGTHVQLYRVYILSWLKCMINKNGTDTFGINFIREEGERTVKNEWNRKISNTNNNWRNATQQNDARIQICMRHMIYVSCFCSIHYKKDEISPKMYKYINIKWTFLTKMAASNKLNIERLDRRCITITMKKKTSYLNEWMHR